MLGLKGNIYFANTTLILYQARAGEGRVIGLALLSNKKIGPSGPEKVGSAGNRGFMRAHAPKGAG